jgi:hypothetical protein
VEEAREKIARQVLAALEERDVEEFERIVKKVVGALER